MRTHTNCIQNTSNDVSADRGLQWNNSLNNLVLDDEELVQLKVALAQAANIKCLIEIIRNCDSLYNGLKKELLVDINTQVWSLSSRTVPFCSVMNKYRDVDAIEDVSGFFKETIQEMANRYAMVY